MTERQPVRNAYLIDRDGVLNPSKGEPVFAAARSWLNRLADAKVPFVIATNHSTSDPAIAFAELEEQLVPVTRQQLHTPLDMVRDYLLSQDMRRVFARGAPGFLDYLSSSGIGLHDGPDVDAVVLGFDRAMDYSALSTAITAVLERSATLVAVHRNRISRDARGNVEPGLGAWVSAVEYATGATAKIFGKPSPTYYEGALSRLGVAAANAVMISDDPFSDLAGAKAVGLQTIFVLTGKYPDPGILDSLSGTSRPDMVFNSIDEVPIE
jgi:4-nitrophenyl phosphatase